MIDLPWAEHSDDDDDDEDYYYDGMSFRARQHLRSLAPIMNDFG